MRAPARSGAVLLPASAGFYPHPATVGEMVDFVVSRILQRIGIDAGLTGKWGEAPEPSKKGNRAGRRGTGS